MSTMPTKIQGRKSLYINTCFAKIASKRANGLLINFWIQMVTIFYYSATCVHDYEDVHDRGSGVRGECGSVVRMVRVNKH